MKILINTPFLHLPGGVANHYIGLKPYWSHNVRYNQIGKRKENFSSGKYWLLYDLVKFIFRIIMWNPNLIVVNPSLGKTALVRDKIFIRLARIFNKRVIVFIHGWDKEFAKTLNKKSLTTLLNSCSGIIVLANEFKNYLVEWGVKSPIHLSTTKVDDRLIKNFKIENKTGEIDSLLFLSRVEKTKGIYIALDAFKIIQQDKSSIKLNVVGSGSELNSISKYVVDQKIHNVTITGNLNGEELINQFKADSIYCFPTFFGEGMPTSVLEAMAFGLPIITRPVGGLVDFFDSKNMGSMIDSLDPQEYAIELIKLINDKEKTLNICKYNHEYAKNHFMASKVASKLEHIFNTAIMF